ncbi:MAG: hypothetical protein NVSMB68_16580 [Thermoanaerobaculia bacterium]
MHRILCENQRPRMDAGPMLQRILREDEPLLRTFVACTPSPLLERSILGSGLQHLRRAIVAVTNERMILIGVHRDLSPRGTVSQISWGDVKSARVGVLRRTVVLRFRNGTRQRFSDLSFEAAGAMRELLPPLVSSGKMTAAKEREPLCAGCLRVLRPGATLCPNCRAPMKRRSHAARLAWWSAGGGYHYLGFRQMALLAGLVDFLFFVAFLLSGIAALQRHGLSGAIALLCTTVLFIEWKAVIVAHTTSLANEITLDVASSRDGSETIFDVIDDALQWMSH